MEAFLQPRSASRGTAGLAQEPAHRPIDYVRGCAQGEEPARETGREGGGPAPAGSGHQEH